MRTIETALWPLERPTPDGGMGVFLGEVGSASLADLEEGECVLLVEPNELQAKAVIRIIGLHGLRWWFGDIGDAGAIHVIYPASGAGSPDIASA